jgi:hypothetical protein
VPLVAVIEETLTGNVEIFTVVLAVAEQTDVDAVTVYVVLAEGVTPVGF